MIRAIVILSKAVKQDLDNLGRTGSTLKVYGYNSVNSLLTALPNLTQFVNSLP